MDFYTQRITLQGAMSIKGLVLILMCLVASESFAREIKPGPSVSPQLRLGPRRPNEYLQPPPLPDSSRASSPSTPRHSTTRLKSVRLNGSHINRSGQYTAAPTLDNSITSTVSLKAVSNSSNTKESLKPSSNASESSHARLLEDSAEISPKSDSGSTSLQRIARWFFSSEESDTKTDSRGPNTNEILRPPPPPRSYSAPPNHKPHPSNSPPLSPPSQHFLSQHAQPSHQFKTHQIPSVPKYPAYPSHSQAPLEPIASGTHPQHLVLPHPHHSPQPPQNQGKGKECNPCNRVPWVPMIRPQSSGPYQGPSDTANSHAHSTNQYLPPPPPSSLPTQYESPSIAALPLQPPGTDYSAPLPPLQNSDNHYGPPPPPPIKPSSHYSGPPPPIKRPESEYGPPPPPQPPRNEYGPPQPPRNEYGPPQPPRNEYGPPQPPRNEYGPPQPPKQGYGPPQPPKQGYGPPQPPKQEYGPPQPPNQEYGPPPPEYKPPHSPSLQQYGPPRHIKSPIHAFGQPPSINSLTDEFGPPPPPPARPNNDEYGPPPPPPNHANHQPVTSYGTPTTQYELQPPKLEQTSHQSDPEYKPPPPPPTSHVSVQQSPQLAPSYLPAPPVHEAEKFKDTSQVSGQAHVIHHPQVGNSNAYSYSSVITGSSGNNNDIQDSHPVASQHPTSASHESSYTDVSSIHLVPDASTTPGFKSGSWHKDENAYPPNDQLHLPSGDTYQSSEQNKLRDQNRNNREPSLEIIPSVQVADYVSSIEYPLQIIQAPYIDVKQPEQSVTKQESSQHVTSSHSQSSSSYDEGEIIIGKPTLAASKLNASKIQNSHHNTNTSEIHDQKLQSSIIHETINVSESGPPIVDHPASSGVIHSSTGNGFFVSENQVKHGSEDYQASQSHFNVNALSTQGTESTSQKGQGSVTLNIQPSIQTSAEGNSIIHQINNALQSNKDSTNIPSFQKGFKQTPSGYLLFQNFPQPPLSYLPADVLKQKLPPPTPFQTSSQNHPYLPPFQPLPQSSHNFFQNSHQSTTTSPFIYALKLQAPDSFLNPPPKPNEEYSTVANTPSPDYTFWTPPPVSSSSSINVGSNWGFPTTVRPLQQNIQKQQTTNQHVMAAFAEAAGLFPPPPAQPESVKKPKQIQIIVPYTSTKDLMQFKVQEDSKPVYDSTGWLPIPGNGDILQGRKVPSSAVNCSDDNWSSQLQCTISNSWQQQNDFHQNQESQTVTQTVPLVDSAKHITQGYPQKNYNEIQHIFAANIRDLLRGEEDKTKIPDSITLQRLQKNIDEWTALEYSKRKNLLRLNSTKQQEDGRKGTTAATSGSYHQLLPSKKIPEEYLTTTPLTFDDGTQTENYVATAVPSFKRIRSTTSSPDTTTITSRRRTTTTPLPTSFNDHDVSASRSHIVRTVTSTSVRTNIRKLKNSETNKHNAENVPVNHQRNKENNKWKIIESNYILPEAVAATTRFTPSALNYTTTTTPSPTTPITHEVTDVYSSYGHTTWDQLPLSISPITNEKVYVVTPVTTWKPDSTTEPSINTSPYTRNAKSINDIIPFRNGPPAPQKLIAPAPFSFKSPRFVVRPTPGTTVQRSFTVTSLESDEEESSKKTTTLEPLKSNEIDNERDVEHVSTTTEMTTKSSGTHLLLGLPTLPTYTPPNGTHVLTDSGHSKVVTVVNSATVATPARKKPTKKQSTVATTKLFPVTTSRPARITRVPQPRGGIPRGDLRKLRPNRGSYAWQFPELAGDSLKKEDAEAIQDAVLELQKNSS